MKLSNGKEYTSVQADLQAILLWKGWDIMAEYVLFGVLALHRDILDYREDQRGGRWQPRSIVHASQRRVGVMGIGN